MSRSQMAAIALAIACGVSTAGELVHIVVGPSSAPEGLPASFQVVVQRASDATLAVSEVRVSFGAATETHSLSRRLRGAWGEPAADGAVTLDLDISEGDIGPVARAPMPPVRTPCGPDEFVTYRLLRPGKDLRFTLRGIPLGCRPAEVRVEVDCFEFQGTVEGLHPALYPKGSANASVSLGDAQPGTFPGPGAASVSCQAWGTSDNEADEVLFDAAVAELLTPTTETMPFTIEVAAAPVPSAQALEKAKLAVEDLLDAVWLAETETWVLETRTGSTLVPKAGEPRAHKGHLAALAARMTEGGPIELSAPMDEALRGELEGASVRTSEGKMLIIQARAQHLGTILDAVEKRGLVIEGQYVTEAPPEGPAADAPTPPQEQGTEIPCIDCQVIRPGLADCPTCKGTGYRFQAARMMDEAGQRTLAQERRVKVDELVAKAKGLSGEESHAAWKEAAQEMRAALTDLLVYGDAWAAAWGNRDAVPSHPDLRAAFIDLIEADLRFGILDAEGRLGAH